MEKMNGCEGTGGEMIFEIREQHHLRTPFRFKVLQYELTEFGTCRYYQSRSFEGRDEAERYKRELERNWRNQ